MQGYLKKKSQEPGFAGGEFCEVISTLTHDLTKARNQLVRLMQQVKPGRDRLYGGYSGAQGPIRAHTPCAGYNVHKLSCSPALGRFRGDKENPRRKSASPPPQKPCRPMTVSGAKQFVQPQQRVPLAKRRVPFANQSDKRLQPRASYSSERPQEKVQYSCEKSQQCNRNGRSDMSDMTDMTDMTDTSDCRSGQSDSTCVNITFDSPERAPECPRCRCNFNTCRGSKPVRLTGSCDPPRLQGGGSNDLARFQGRGKRHDMGTVFAAQLEDVTFQLRERRLGANLVRRF